MLMEQSSRRKVVKRMLRDDATTTPVEAAITTTAISTSIHWAKATIVLLVTLLALTDHTQVLAQVGTELCGCQPATYTFTFDFGRTCADATVAGPGINDTACLAEISGQEQVPDERLVPVSIESVQIFELDQNLQVVAQTARSGTFVDGDSFTYTSIVSTITDLLDEVSLPRGLQLVTTGFNEQEDSVVSTYIILYTNDCGIFPILTEGQAAGWTIFSDLGPPPIEVCPIAPTRMPAILDSQPPSNAPSASLLSAFPSEAPSSLSPSVSFSPTRENATMVPTPIPTKSASSSILAESLPPICPPTTYSSKGKGSRGGKNSSISGKNESGKSIGNGKSGRNGKDGKDGKSGHDTSSSSSGKNGKSKTSGSEYSFDGKGKSGKSGRDNAETILGNSKKDRYYGSSSSGVMQRVSEGSGYSLRKRERRALGVGNQNSDSDGTRSSDSASYNIVEECIEPSLDEGNSIRKPDASSSGNSMAASLLKGKAGKSGSRSSNSDGKSGKSGDGKAGGKGSGITQQGINEGSASASVSASVSRSGSGSTYIERFDDYGGRSSSSDRQTGKGKSSSSSSSDGKGKGTTTSNSGKGKSRLSKRNLSSSNGGMSKQSVSRSESVNSSSSSNY